MADKAISALTAATALTGAELIPVVQSGTTKKATIEQVKGYKVYTALLSQSGGNAPVATILENTLGEVPVWSYVAPGHYALTTIGNVFTINKSVSPQSGLAYYNANSINTWYAIARRGNNVTFTLDVYDFSGAAADDILTSGVAGDGFLFQIFIFS